MTVSLAPYRVVAFNSARHSENKMHDDLVARQFGFGGGLVPGVDVYAYMAHPAVAHWGRAFLEGGRLEARFLKPVYDGEPTTVTAHPNGGGLAIEVSCRGELAASGCALLEAVPPPASDVDPIPAAAEAQRAPVDQDTLRPGRWLGIRPLVVTEPFAAQYCADVRETDALYARDKLCHPGLLPRLFNWALAHNVLLGPWIHVGSKVQHFAAVRIGDELGVRAKVTANYERKGHQFVELDGLVLANGQQPIARVEHVAIWRPRLERA